MSYDLNYLNERVRQDAAGFVEECEAGYAEKVTAAARAVADNISRSPIVLLSGPSGSGKTTTAKRVCDALEALGIKAHTVSLDDYYLSPRLADGPRTPEGGYDYESPLCLDWELINEHFSMLENGKSIRIPCFVFSKQARSPSKFKPMSLGKNEIAIFEGIHALSSLAADAHKGAFRLYISARSDITDGGANIIFKRTWVRLVRRVIRDEMFRGANALVTMAMWANVRRGEKEYISPFKDSADLQLDTVIPYELHAMRDLALDIFRRAPEGAERYDEVREILTVLPRFEGFDRGLVPANSMIREFFGGGIYEY